MPPESNKPGTTNLVRPRFWLSLLLLLSLLVLAGLGQWDWVLAVVIGLFLGNGLSSLFEKRSR